MSTKHFYNAQVSLMHAKVKSFDYSLVGIVLYVLSGSFIMFWTATFLSLLSCIHNN